jgi:carbonic anhydrase
VVRNAGNLLSDHVIGSIEYAVEHLHAPLIVVMGHTRCGAVAAAVAGGEAGGHVQSIVDSLAFAVAAARARGGDTADQAEQMNARMSADALAASDPVLAKAEGRGRALQPRHGRGGMAALTGSTGAFRAAPTQPPCSASQRSASIAAWQPMPAAVIACR